MKPITSERVGQLLQQAAHRIAPAIVATFTAGLCLGLWVHRTNDQLAALWVRLWAPQPVQAQQSEPLALPYAIEAMLDECEALVAEPEPMVIMAQAPEPVAEPERKPAVAKPKRTAKRFRTLQQCKDLFQQHGLVLTSTLARDELPSGRLSSTRSKHYWVRYGVRPEAVNDPRRTFRKVAKAELKPRLAKGSPTSSKDVIAFCNRCAAEGLI